MPAVRNIPVTPLTDISGSNFTGTHLSTNIFVKVEGNIIGAMQSLDIDENRPVKFFPQIGADGFFDSAPTGPTSVTGSCSRVRYFRQRILEAFGRSYIHIHSQRIPFDIEIQDIFHDGDPSNAIITTLRNVWFKSQRYSYSADNYPIIETCSFEAEGISSIMNNKNVAQAVANGRTQPIILNAYEQEADRGSFTGSLDAAGLIDAFRLDPRN